jgi:phage-related protein
VGTQRRAAATLAGHVLYVVHRVFYRSKAGRIRCALCRAIGQGLWEIRTALPSKRIARVLLCLDKGALVALHAFIKKTQKTPDDELAVARKRQKELKS